VVNKLGHLVNKPVLVSIPSVFGGAEPRSCRLVGLDAAGLWLESADLSGTIIAVAGLLPPTFFVPFTQIAYVLEARAPSPIAETQRPKSGQKTPVASRRKLRS
jgi:hypothetical protein